MWPFGTLTALITARVAQGRPVDDLLPVVWVYAVLPAELALLVREPDHGLVSLPLERLVYLWTRSTEPVGGLKTIK